MKEDLIVIPEMDVFKSLITDARKDLSELDLTDDEESTERRDLALEVIDILDEKIKNTSDLNKISFKEKIWFASHLYLLETVLEDLFEDDEDFFLDEEEEEEEK
jgi:hypothetical protein